MTETFDGISADEWHDELELWEEWGKRHLLAAIAMLGFPRRMLDVGCGLGGGVLMARSLGIDAVGLDQLVENEDDVFIHHNLVDRYFSGRPFEWVWCIEVAEHLDPTAHATLCDTLNDNLTKDGLLIFSAAHPNQGGMGHVSERTSRYWQDQFFLRGLCWSKELTVNLSLLWSNIGSPFYWLPSNVLVFKK